MIGDHSKIALSIERPLGRGAVPIELHTNPIGVDQIKRLGYAVIGSSGTRIVCFHQSFQYYSEVFAGGVQNCCMEQASCTFGCGRSVFAVPGVKSDMMVISASGDESGLASVALR